MAMQPNAAERATGTVAPDQQEPPDLPLKTATFYSSGNFGGGIFYGFNNFILTLFLHSLHVPIILNDLLGSTRSFEGAIIQPLVGAWSDRTWRPGLGRRRPFILWFAPICALMLAITPFVAQATALGKPLGLTPNTTAIILAVVCIFIFTLTFNILFDPYQALLADITPERQRGSINGLFTAIGAGGQVAILVAAIALSTANRNTLPTTPLFLATAIALIICFIPTMLGVREPHALPGGRDSHRYGWRDYARGLRNDPQALLYFATQFFLWFGINAITPNLTYYARDSLHFTDTQALILSFILLLSSAIFVWPIGILGDRIGLKRTFVFGMALMAGAAIAAVFIHSVALLFIVLGIAGVGNAAQSASSYPLLTRLTLPDRMGLYTGLNSTVTSIAAPGGALISGLLITRFGYSVFFPFVAAMFLISLAPLAALQVERSIAQRAMRGEIAV